MNFFTTLNKFDAAGTPIKYDNYDTESEAQDRIIELHNIGLTDAFYIDSKATAVDGYTCFQTCTHWTANLIAKTVTLNKVSLEAEEREEHMRSIRRKRDNLLMDSDKYVNPDQWASMDTTLQNEWSVYRQELRDLPATVDDPADPTWPVEPK